MCGYRPRVSSLISLATILFLVESLGDSLFCFLSWSSDANRQQGLLMTENRELGAGRFWRAFDSRCTALERNSKFKY